jgi:hypothetical protein
VSNPAFQKRHYEKIAEAIQEARGDACIHTAQHPEAINVVVNELADAFARDNGQFQRGRFIAACECGANVRARS